MNCGLEYNVNPLNHPHCHTPWNGMQCAPTLPSPMLLLLVSSYIMWPTIYTMKHIEMHGFPVSTWLVSKYWLDLNYHLNFWTLVIRECQVWSGMGKHGSTMFIYTHTWLDMVGHVWTWSNMDCVWLALVGNSSQLTLSNLALFSLRGEFGYVL